MRTAGDNAEIGKISKMVSEVTSGKTNLLIQMEVLARWLACIVGVISLATFLLALLHAKHNAGVAFQVGLGCSWRHESVGCARWVCMCCWYVVQRLRAVHMNLPEQQQWVLIQMEVLARWLACIVGVISLATFLLALLHAKHNAGVAFQVGVGRLVYALLCSMNVWCLCMHQVNSNRCVHVLLLCGAGVWLDVTKAAAMDATLKACGTINHTQTGRPAE
jgi:cation transport ATPase